MLNEGIWAALQGGETYCRVIKLNRDGTVLRYALIAGRERCDSAGELGFRR
ncbi:MAG: hypothetical protein LBJ10_03930 [Clostridiales bacterium]|jgi:hypothetical protein|nr:hypothetical protein [Clostridiales bacterium]